MVSHDLSDLMRNCDVGFVVQDGQASYYADIHEAVEAYKRNVLNK